MKSAGARKRSLADTCLMWLRVAHQWLGIAGCLLCVMWFLSGLVMMYVPFPVWSESDRLRVARPLDGAQIKVAPNEALLKANLPMPPNSFLLEMWGTEPMYRFLAASGAIAVSARDGRRIEKVSLDDVGQRLAETGFKARHVRQVDRDQWTVTSSYNALRPFYVFALDDEAGTELYLSARTGEIGQKTTSHQRFWNYLGAVPHWIYLTSIRSNSGVWRQVIIWTSGIVIVLALSGFALGIYRSIKSLRARRRELSPFRLWLRWHHIAGLIGGLPLIAWIITGWLSVNPFGLFASQPPLFQNMPAYYGISKQSFALAAQQVADIVAAKNARQVSFTWLDQMPLAIASDGNNKTTLSGIDGTVAPLTDEALAKAAQNLLPGNKIIQLQRLISEDNYWYSHRTKRPLPILRIGFDDGIGSWIHVDPDSGRIIGILNNEQRAYRWIFNLFHSLDLPILLRNRPLWDALMVLLLVAGLAVSLTGVVVGWRALKRIAQQG